MNVRFRSPNRPPAERPTRIPWRAVALPTEHGGWGFLLEPMLLGWLLAPSNAAAWLSLTSLSAFLLRHPLNLALADWRRGKRYPRTRAAVQVAFVYALLGGLGLIMSISSAAPAFWWPLLLAVPLAAVQLYFDAQSNSRALLPELLGSLGLAMLAPCMLAAAHWPLATVWPLWLALAARNISSILYVRARLRLERQERVSLWPSLMAHLVSWLLLLWLSTRGELPWTAVLALAVLSARAAYGLSPYRSHLPARAVGVQEMLYGLGFGLLLALGYLR